jgi:acyl-CoA synthetase (AMP-forming)/AMP-acid ligase II
MRRIAERGLRRALRVGPNGRAAAAVCSSAGVFRGVVVVGVRPASSLVSSFRESVSSLPAREAVRYTGKNLKWTAEEFEGYVDAHANALLEQGIGMGDVIGVWLPEGAEKHVTLMAAAKMGVEVVDYGESDAISTVEDLRSALGSASVKALFFEPTTASQDNLLLLRQAIPEFYHYDDSHGQMFHSKYYPSLAFFVQTGFDIEMGCLNYKSLFLHHPETSLVDSTAAATKDDMPLYSSLASGAKASHGDVLKDDTWGFAKKIVEKQYFEQN